MIASGAGGWTPVPLQRRVLELGLGLGPGADAPARLDRDEDKAIIDLIVLNWIILFNRSREWNGRTKEFT